jgi:hypothetical protein
MCNKDAPKQQTKGILTMTKLTMIAALLLTATSAMANPTLNGCETKEAKNGGYFVLVDATCVGFRSTRADDVGLTQARAETPDDGEEDDNGGDDEGETTEH